MRTGVLLLAAALGVTGAARADDGHAVHLRLRSQAVITGDTVTLGDVLVFPESAAALAEQVADEPVLPEAALADGAMVTHAQVQRRLHELGVNLARVLVGGALRCELNRVGAVVRPDREGPADTADFLVRPRESRAAVGERTLADLLRAHVASELAELDDEADVRFERAGNEFLQLTTPPWDFIISSPGRDKLGLRTFHVTVRRDGRVQRKAELFAQVRLVRPAVVARKPLNPGNFVRPDEVTVETRVFEAGQILGLAQPEEVVGQQVKKFVGAGQMVTPDALKAVDLVRRSRPVTVVGDSGAVEVRLTGMALDSGGYGEAVRVRTGDTRGERQVLRGIVTGLGTVRLAEGER